MTPDEQQRIIERYNERLTNLGETAQALGWRDSSQQHLRFRMLAEISDLTGCSIMDIGCGFGDLLEYDGLHDGACHRWHWGGRRRRGLRHLQSV